MNKAILSCFSKEQRRRLSEARVGIAGAGGLGSNAAMLLARSGVGHLLIVDGDTVAPSNLNRQHYFPRHVGRPKVEALAEQIRELAPQLEVEVHQLWLHRDNIPSLLERAPLWIEALDRAESKALFATAAFQAGKTVICGSGMGGFGNGTMSRRILQNSTSGGLLAIVGDFRSDVATAPPLGPRVMQCAAMEADAVLEWILTGRLEVFP